MNSLVFPPFRLDPVNECLWRDTQRIPLRGKTFAVLCCLLEHPGQLVSKEALFNAVWPETYVSDVVLMGCIHQLRKALGDNTQKPRFIETVHRRGYRFIAEVVSSQHSVVSSLPLPTQSSVLNTQHSVLVGREAELAQLHGWLGKALHGERQIVFVTGEAGIGKTSVVESFLRHVAADGSTWIGRGQCIQHYGAGEGYMPMLEALGRLCREPEGDHLIELLSRHAPTWLVQMPALLNAADLEALQRKVAGATRERMLREMAEAVEVLTAERPLVLSFEDLHWSDASTLELLSVLARRQEQARLLVLGTYRPVEMLANGHPLRTVKQELQLHRQCAERQLGLLTEENVAEYLAVRFSLEEGARPYSAPTKAGSNNPPPYRGQSALHGQRGRVPGRSRRTRRISRDGAEWRAWRPTANDRGAASPAGGRGTTALGGGECGRDGVLGRGGGRGCWKTAGGSSRRAVCAVGTARIFLAYEWHGRVAGRNRSGTLQFPSCLIPRGALRAVAGRTAAAAASAHWRAGRARLWRAGARDCRRTGDAL